MFKWLVDNAGRLPQLIPDQILKLKQLTVLTLARTYEVFFLCFGSAGYTRFYLLDPLLLAILRYYFALNCYWR